VVVWATRDPIRGCAPNTVAGGWFRFFSRAFGREPRQHLLGITRIDMMFCAGASGGIDPLRFAAITCFAVAEPVSAVLDPGGIDPAVFLIFGKRFSDEGSFERLGYREASVRGPGAGSHGRRG